MKHNKQHMKGAGYWARVGKKIGTRMKKTAVGTHKVLTHGSNTKSPTLKSKYVKMLGSPTSSLTTPPTYVFQKAEQGIKGIGRMGALTFTRSGKAKKQIRQELGITNYNELKRKATKINTKKSEYQRQKNELQQQIINTTNGVKEGEITNKHEKKLAKLEAKLNHQDWKAKQILNKWDTETRKPKRTIKSGAEAFNLKRNEKEDVLNSKGNIIVSANGTVKQRNRTVSEQLKKAEEHFETQAQKITQETLDKVHTAKTEYDVYMKPHDDAVKNIEDAQNAIIKQNEEKNTLSEQYKSTTNDYAKANILLQIKQYNELQVQTKIKLNEEKDKLKKALKGLKTDEFKKARNKYEAAQQAYIKRSGKAQDLTNLDSRSKESITKSFKRLSIPDFGIDRKITRKSKIYGRANVTNKEEPTESQKKDKDWIVAYWTKQESGRPQELKRLEQKGKVYLASNGEKKQLDKDGKYKHMNLKDIVTPKDMTIENMTNKEFSKHINKLEEEGKISVKEHDVLKKYHTALRISKMISNADITKRKKEINTSVKSLDELKQFFPNYSKKTQLTNNNLKTFGEDSNYKRVKVYEHEFNEEKKRMTLALNRIDQTTDEKEKQTLIENLYKRYMPRDTIPTVKNFNRKNIETDENIIHNKVQKTEFIKSTFDEDFLNYSKTLNSETLKTEVKNLQNEDHGRVLDKFSQKSKAIQGLTNFLDKGDGNVREVSKLLQFSARLKDLQDLRNSADDPQKQQTLKELEAELGINFFDEKDKRISDEELKKQLLDVEGADKFGMSEGNINGYKKMTIDKGNEFMQKQIEQQKQIRLRAVDAERQKLKDLQKTLLTPFFKKNKDGNFLLNRNNNYVFLDDVDKDKEINGKKFIDVWATYQNRSNIIIAKINKEKKYFFAMDNAIAALNPVDEA